MQIWREWFGVELSEVSAIEKLISTVGGIVAIWILITLGHCVLDGIGGTFIVGSMGASAVLLFAVPHGQLSQPWPVIAGHGFSALIGVLCARWIPSQELAAAASVGLAIGVMHQLKCIHPPGGATALTAVIGGPAVRELGLGFVVCPVLVNAIWLVLLAVLINAAFRWRRYPAKWVRLQRSASPIPAQAEHPTHEEIVQALKSLDSFVDITEDDLVRLCRILSAQQTAKSTANKTRVSFPA